jgi:phosphohistidine phosphatase
MDRLILLRHGKAEADAPSGRDFDRALTDRGRRDAALIARILDEAGLAPDLVLVSPAARAAQTWEAAAAFFPKARAVEGAAAGTVMVVGHNPGLGQLAAWLAQEARSGEARVQLAQGFPTAAAAVIAFSPPAVELFTPKTLGGGT